MKRTYIIGVREVRVRHYSVQAENEDEAKDLIYEMATCVVDIEMEEFSHQLDRDTWSVEEVPNKTGQSRHNTEGAEP
jgi:hypothetical protein